MHVGKKMQKREKSAMSVSLYGNLVFVVIELVMALVTGSQAVLLDAVYDSVEFCMLLPSIFLIPLLYKPSNEEHPFGSVSYTHLDVYKRQAMINPATAGTNATLPGISLRSVHLCLAPGGQMQFVRQPIDISSFGLVGCSSEYTTFSFFTPRFLSSLRITFANGHTLVL